MKKKWILIVILSLILLGVLAGGIYYFMSNPVMSDSDDVDKPSKEEIQNYIDHFDLSTLEFEKIQPSVYKYSKKLGFFDEVFSSQKPVFAYGYEKGSRMKYISEKFHKQMQKDFADNGFDEKYTIVTISKPEAQVNDVMKKYKLEIPDEESPCDLKDSDMKGVLDIVDVMSMCYGGACLIDNKKKVFLSFTKDYPEVILKLLKEYK